VALGGSVGFNKQRHDGIFKELNVKHRKCSRVSFVCMFVNVAQIYTRTSYLSHKTAIYGEQWSLTQEGVTIVALPNSHDPFHQQLVLSTASSGT
jgi:hypothetical protein